MLITNQRSKGQVVVCLRESRCWHNGTYASAGFLNWARPALAVSGSARSAGGAQLVLKDLEVDQGAALAKLQDAKPYQPNAI